MLRLVLGVLMSRRAQSAALLTLAVLTLAAATAAPLYATVADQTNMTAQLRAATAAERAITFTAEIPAGGGYAPSLEALSTEVAARVGKSPLTQVSGVFVSASIGVAGNAWSPAPVVSREHACHHLTLLEGACFSGPTDVVISEPTARNLDVHIGSELYLQAGDSSTQVTRRVTGVYDAVAAQSDNDPYWAGRVDLAAQSLGVSNPVFVASEAIDTLGAESVIALVDLYAEERALTADNLSAAADSAKAASQSIPNAQVTNGLSRLLTRVQTSRDELGLVAPVGAMRLMFLAWFVLLIAVVHIATARRAELAVVSLRGTPVRHRLLFSLGPTVLLLLIAGPIGVGLGWLTVYVVAVITLPGSLPVPLDITALLTAAATMTLILASTMIAERRQARGSISDALRQVPPPRARTFGLIELAAITLATIAVTQSYASPDESSPLVSLAPMLVALVLGLLAARVVGPLATTFGSHRLHRGHLATALPALELARRPGADRIVALTVVVVALIGYTVCAWDVTAADTRRQAELELGAPRVLTVGAASGPALIAAVHRADPDGAWAMAATRASDGELTSIGVETSRLAAISIWPREATLTAREAAAAMHPKIAEPLMLTGAGLDLDFTVVKAIRAPMHVTVGLVGPSGENITGGIDVAPGAGRARYSMAMPACAVHPGCRLAWLSFPRSADDVHLNALVQREPQRTLLGGGSISAASRWRTALGSESEVTIISGGMTGARANAAAMIDEDPLRERESGYVSLRYLPTTGSRISTDIRMFVNDGPLPLPIVAAGPASLGDTRELSASDVLPSMPGPVDVLRVSPLLPGVVPRGALFDLEYADRIDTDLDGAVALQVWLGADAPQDAAERLRGEGLQVIRDETVAAKVAQLEQQGTGLTLRLELGAAVLSVVLMVLGLFVISAADRPARSAELAALRAQGLPAATARRVAQLGNLAMVAAAAPVGVLAVAVAWALPRPAPVGVRSSGLPLPDPNVGLASGAIILAIAVVLGAALLVGRSLIRAASRGDADGSRDRL